MSINKKAEGGETYNKILVVILVLIVVSLIIFALFKIDIPGKIRDLIPDYKYNNSDSEINVANDSKIDTNSPGAINSLCKGNIIGSYSFVTHKVWYKDWINGYGAWIDKIYYISIENSPTKLYWNANEMNIKHDVSWSDSKIGIVTNDRTIIIDQSYFNEANFKKEFGNEITLDVLKELNGARLVAAGNKICKE